LDGNNKTVERRRDSLRPAGVWSSGADVSAQDIGNYTCEVHGPHNVLLANVTHSVFVAGSLLSFLRALRPTLFILTFAVVLN